MRNGLNTRTCIHNFSKCGVRNPSWAEISHFTKFLDVQLNSCENSVFCDETLVGDVMSGLKGFVVKFMIRMSQVRLIIVIIVCIRISPASCRISQHPLWRECWPGKTWRWMLLKRVIMTN